MTKKELALAAVEPKDQALIFPPSLSDLFKKVEQAALSVNEVELSAKRHVGRKVQRLISLSQTRATQVHGILILLRQEVAKLLLAILCFLQMRVKLMRVSLIIGRKEQEAQRILF
jgi:hypothetical protein